MFLADGVGAHSTHQDLVTSSGAKESKNFNHDEHLQHALHDKRAAEFHDLVTWCARRRAGRWWCRQAAPRAAA